MFGIVIRILSFIIAPCILVLFSVVSAYVFKFGLSRTGIIPDYIVFSLFVVIALLAGGVI